MKYLDINGAKVSKIILGTDSLGSLIGEEDSFRLLDEYIARGGNCIDTARIYANWLPGGADASEKCIGKWMKLRSCRNRVILITKGGTAGKGSQYGTLARDEIDADITQSLRCLDTDYIDIYMIHRDDVRRPVGDIMETLARYVDSGCARMLACSNWSLRRIDEANEYSEKYRLPRLACSEIQWSLASSTPEAHGDPSLVCMHDAEYDGYLKKRFPVLAFSSQAKGFFSKIAEGGKGTLTEKASVRFGTKENFERAERVMEVARRMDLSPSAVALSFITCNRLPSAAIVGCKTLEHLRDSLSAADAEMDPKTVLYLQNGNMESED